MSNYIKDLIREGEHQQLDFIVESNLVFLGAATGAAASIDILGERAGAGDHHSLR